MKLAVFSDSHGDSKKMLDIVARTRPDMIVHLGDGERDVIELRERFPDIPLHAVSGNCDFRTAKPETELFEVEGIKFFITHGHLFGVKSTRAKLIEQAVRRSADVVMYGHTHCAQLLETDRLMLLNPGSCGASASPSYAAVTVENGECKAEIIKL